jgi:hypothetical protein
MTTLDDLPFHDGHEFPPTANGAKGAKPCRRHDWYANACRRCGVMENPTTSRRGRTNRSRGNRAELDVARSIPGGRKMGPLGLPWDVEVGDYARLQVKKLIHPPSPAEIARLIRAIPDTGDRLRGFVWIEAAGQGKRGKRTVWFLAAEFTQWHGADFGPHDVALVTMPLATWVAEFVHGPDAA